MGFDIVTWMRDRQRQRDHWSLLKGDDIGQKIGFMNN